MPRVFLLSPANLSGRRAAHLFRADAPSPLAARLRSPAGATIGEVFRYASGLYFRGKLEYASTFASPPPDRVGVHVIVPGMGLLPPTELVDIERLRAIADTQVAVDNPSYMEPLLTDLRSLSKELPATEVVFLGSIATDKYIVPLSDGLGDQLRVPRELIGLGLFSRGALLARCAREARELEYVGRPRPRR